MKRVESSGVVILRKEDDDFLVLLMRSHDYWDFPKGGIEENESKLKAALREVKEETGIEDLNFKWGKIFYKTETYGRINKTAYYFLAETYTKNVFIENNPLTGIKEHEEYKWVKLNDAKEMTVYRIQKVIEWAEERIYLQKNKKNNIK